MSCATTFKEETSIDIQETDFTTVEALDEVSGFDQDQSSDDEDDDVNSNSQKKRPRKRPEIKEKNESGEKLQCQCGLLLSNKSSFNRHVDRVSQKSFHAKIRLDEIRKFPETENLSSYHFCQSLKLLIFRRFLTPSPLCLGVSSLGDFYATRLTIVLYVKKRLKE